MDSAPVGPWAGNRVRPGPRGAMMGGADADGRRTPPGVEAGRHLPAAEYVQLTLSTEYTAAQQAFGAHAGQLRGVFAPGFTVELHEG